MSASATASPGQQDQQQQQQQQAAPDAAALQKQIDDLKAELGEKDRAIEFWHGKANSGAGDGKTTKQESTEDTDVDVLELLTTKGSKGLNDYLAKNGYVRAEDVDKRVNAKAEAFQREQTLIAKYPDLKDQKSEFFKATASAYGQLVKSGVSESVAMEIAAERTELQFMREGKIKTPAEQKADKEAARRARIAAQAGEGTGRTPAHTEEEDDTLDDNQMRIVRSMLIGSPGKDGKPMSEEQAVEAYKARAKAGVAMKGVR